MMAALYLRVSTSNKEGDQFVQNLEVQKKPLLDLCKSRGWKIHKVYSDRMSGANVSRPGYRALMDDARRGLFKVVVVWKFDRWARSLKDLVLSLDEFRSLNIAFVSHTEAIDTDTAMGRMMFAIVSALAEFERNLIRERVTAGLENAKLNGTKSGKSIGRPKRVFRRDEVVELRSQGVPWRDIAARLDVPIATLVRTCSKPIPGKPPRENVS